MEYMLLMICSPFHKKPYKFIMWLIQPYVRTFVAGVSQSEQNPEDMFKLRKWKMNYHIKLTRSLMSYQL